jgi:hypothetical protein
MATAAAAASAAAVGEVVATAAAGAVALAAALVDWQQGELSPSTAGSVASEGGAFLDMTDV